MKTQKYVFLQALVITIIIFNLGIYLGYKLETSRVDKIEEWYLRSEMELLDQRIQESAFDVVDLDCNSVFEENIKFADRIFEQALVIKEYEDANRINEDIIILHKKYDLLRTLFWVNSMKIKEKCALDYHNVVYLYDYDEPTIDQKAKQRFFSNLLGEIKERKGSEIMLIPIAADNDLASLNLLLDKFGVTELPVILIDEMIKVTDVESVDDVEKYLG
ncbi:MAG: hypothetical protein ABIA78_01070 [archaeon]